MICVVHHMQRGAWPQRLDDRPQQVKLGQLVARALKEAFMQRELIALLEQKVGRHLRP
jgi:predicted protein tyrosine phosphatase